METEPESSLRAPGTGIALALAALVGVALLGAAALGDGSDVDGILPVGGAAVVLLAGALFAVGLGYLPSPRTGRSGGAVVLAMLLLVAWIGTTIAWSIVPDRSWETFNRGVAFAAFLGLGLVLAAVGGRIAARLVASMLALVTGIVLVWALLSKIVPSLDPEGDRVARLREPVEYWNALALLADVALALGLWLGASRGHRAAVRVAGGLLVYVATLALMLTLSRVGLATGVAVVLLWLALSEERVAGGLLLVASAGPAALVGGWAYTRPALVEDVAERSDRVADGAVLGVLALGGALAVAALVALGARRGLGERTSPRIGRGLLAAAALTAVIGAVGLGLAVERSLASNATCAEIANDPSRLRSVDLSNRWCWWGDAWEVYRANAPEGAGSGSYEIARKRYREDARNVVQPHSVVLQQLSDGGIVALGLFLAVVLAAGATCVCVLRRLAGAERAAAVALVAAPAAYGLHSLVDYDWDFLAVTAPVMVALGALAGAGREAGAPRRRPLLAVAAVLVALTVLGSFAAPRLADRYVRASTRALDEPHPALALQRALRAKGLNPLAVEPIYAIARVHQRGVAPEDAEEHYVDAVELQPENPETWYFLGLYEYNLGRMCAAWTFLNNAYTLDPAGRQWSEGGPLDIALEAVNRGACERS
jgi:O-antigen ligase